MNYSNTNRVVLRVVVDTVLQTLQQRQQQRLQTIVRTITSSSSVIQSPSKRTSGTTTSLSARVVETTCTTVYCNQTNHRNRVLLRFSTINQSRSNNNETGDSSSSTAVDGGNSTATSDSSGGASEQYRVSPENDDAWKNLSPLERYEKLRLRAQERRKIRSSTTSAKEREPPKKKVLQPWEYNENEDYDLLEDYYMDRSRRIPKQFTIIHYEKARESLMNFIQTNHLQKLQDETTTSSYLLPTIQEYTTQPPTPTTAATEESTSQREAEQSPPQQQPVTAASAVNACINLLELVYYEIGESNTLPKDKLREIAEVFCDPKLYNPIFNAWKFITIQYRKKMQWKYGKNWKQHEPQYQHYMPGEPQTLDQYDCIKDDLNIPIPGRIVLQKIIRMSHYLPRFEYDIATINIILQVIYLQCESPNKAPFILENVLNYILRHKKSTRRMYSGKLCMDVYTYSILLNSYCESTNMPNIYMKINSLREQMKAQNIAPNIVIYNTLLRFWGKRGSVEQMNAIVQEMEMNQIPLDLACRSLLVHGYVQTPKNVSLGEDQFKYMIEQYIKPKAVLDRRSIDLMQKSAHYLLDAYRKQLTHNRTIYNPYQDGNVVTRAEYVIQQLELYNLLDDPKNNNRYIGTVSVRSVCDGGAILLGTMMDIYRHVNDIERAYDTFLRIPPVHRNVVTYSILMNAYGKCNQPMRSQEILYELLQNKHIQPDIEVFNTVINAWMESTDHDATERAFDILRLIKEHPICVRHSIVPNEATYNALLKCLSVAGIGGHTEDAESKDAALKAEALLNEMENSTNDTRMKPDMITYTMAIRACLRVNDTIRAESLLRRMENSDTPPDRITYNIILNHCSKLNTTAAAEKATQLLQYMLSASHQQQQPMSPSQPSSNSSSNSNSNSAHDLKPDLYSYSRVIAAWAGSGDPNASNRIWKIYQSMIHDEKLSLNMVCYTKILAFFSKTNSITDLHRAIQVLEAMEQQSSLTSTSNDNNPTNPSTGSDVMLRPDFWHYNSIISRSIEIGHVEVAAQILQQSVAAYIKGITRKPKGVMFQEVVRGYIRDGNLVEATIFLSHMKDVIEMHHKPVGLDISTVHELIQAWHDSDFFHTEREENIQKLKKSFFAPEQ